MKRKTNDLKIPIILMSAAFIAELAGFFVSNSLSLLADTFFISVETLFLAMIFTRLKSKNVITFSLAFSLLIFLASLSMIYFAVQRLVYGSSVMGLEMLAFASAGLAANTFSMRKIRKLYKLKPAGSLLHVIRKTLTSLFVIAGGIWIALTREVFIDPVLGVLIAFAVMFESILLFRDSALLLLGSGRAVKDKTYLFKHIIQ